MKYFIKCVDSTGKVVWTVRKWVSLLKWLNKYGWWTPKRVKRYWPSFRTHIVQCTCESQKMVSITFPWKSEKYSSQYYSKMLEHKFKPAVRSKNHVLLTKGINFQHDNARSFRPSAHGATRMRCNRDRIFFPRRFLYKPMSTR